MQTYRFKAIAQAPYPVQTQGTVQTSSYPAAARLAATALMDELSARGKRRRIDGPIIIKVERLKTRKGQEDERR